MAQAVTSIVRDPQLEAARVPPQSIEAEQSVLGGLLLDNTAWDRIADVLGEADFYRNDHRAIFNHIARLIEDNKPADALTVAESLERSGKLAEVGGQAYIGTLAINTPSAANIRRYAEIVRERSIMRNLAAIGTEIADSAYSPLGRDASVLIDEAEAKIFRIAEARSKAHQGFIKIDPILTETVERIDMLYSRENKHDVIGVPTGFVDLDRMTSGLQAGELIIVAGRPSMGKTTIVMNMAEHVALFEKKAVAVFSMEMSGPQLAMRMIGSVGRVDQHELRTGTFKEDDWTKLVDAVGKLNEAQMYIDDTAGLNVLEVRSRARRLHRQCGGLSLIIIDYLQLMSGTSNTAGENRATRARTSGR
jgi:replicative DNA helicase